MTGALLGVNAVAAAMTLAGGLVPRLGGILSKRALWRMFSVRSGILLAVAFLDVLPEAWGHDASAAGWGALAAFSLLFTLESFSMLDCCPEYLEECSVHLFGWTALVVLFGHALIDGVNLTVSFSAGPAAGAAVGAALALHKLADGFTLTALLGRGGYPRASRTAALCAIAAATPLGSLAALAGLPALPDAPLAGLLGFAGGSFLYIGAADILPRMHKSDDKADPAFFLGGALAVALLGALG